MSWKGFVPDHALLMRRRPPLSESLETLAAELLALHPTAVFGEGNPKARLVFVGDAPTEEELNEGRPFQGPSGQLLDKMIVAMGLSREQVYLTNVTLERTVNASAPTSAELAASLIFLARQLSAIQPEIVVALGQSAASALLMSNEPLSVLRGLVHAVPGKSYRVVPTHSPADLLRAPDAKREAWEDLKRVAKELALPISRS